MTRFGIKNFTSKKLFEKRKNWRIIKEEVGVIFEKITLFMLLSAASSSRTWSTQKFLGFLNLNSNLYQWKYWKGKQKLYAKTKLGKM